MVPDLGYRFIELEELAGTDRRAVRQIARPTFAKNWVERILGKDVFDVGNQQLLVLLLVLNAERDQRVQLRQIFFIGIPEKLVDVRID